jgi:hypothetical protein
MCIVIYRNPQQSFSRELGLCILFFSSHFNEDDNKFRLVYEAMDEGPPKMIVVRATWSGSMMFAISFTTCYRVVSEQNGSWSDWRMRRLVWIHAGRKRIMLVLSWRGSYLYFQLKQQAIILIYIQYCYTVALRYKGEKKKHFLWCVYMPTI